MTNVVPLRRKPPPPLLPVTSESFRRAWQAFPPIGRKRSSTAEAWPEWSKIAAEVGEEVLEQAVHAFVADPDGVTDRGAPGFHRWLKWGRYENWLGKQAPEVLSARRFPDPELRAAFHMRFTDERARRWFDRCELTKERVVLSPFWSLKREWMAGPWRKWAQQNDVRGLSIAPY